MQGSCDTTMQPIFHADGLGCKHDLRAADVICSQRHLELPQLVKSEPMLQEYQIWQLQHCNVHVML